MDQLIPPNVPLERLADARLAAIIDGSFDAIISKDLNSIVTSWNAAAERMFGYSSEEAIGSSILMLIPLNKHSDEEEIISRIRSGQRIESFETVRVRKDGSPIHVSLTVSPIKDDTGRIVGASKIARDISATKESERRIRLLMREVNHRVKNQFSVILSMVRATAQSAVDMESFKNQIVDRVMALSRSHDLLVESEWTGAGLLHLVEEHIKPFSQTGRILVSGPMINLSPGAVQHLGMAFHELATNSAKHGALSQAVGTVSVEWTIRCDDVPTFKLVWNESFERTPFEGKRRVGFGTVVLGSVTPRGLMGEATAEHLPTGFRWILTAPMSAVAPEVE